MPRVLSSPPVGVMEVVVVVEVVSNPPFLLATAAPGAPFTVAFRLGVLGAPVV